MAELSLEIVADVVEACKAGADEAASAFGRVLEADVQLSVGVPCSFDTRALPEGLDGPGLAVVLTVGATGAMVVLPESCGLLPAWYGDPDPTGQGKLATLAQELGMVLLPEQYRPDGVTASRVESLSEALARGGVSEGAAMLPLELQPAKEARATAHLIWPAANPRAVIGQPDAEAKPEVASPARSPSKPKPVTGPQNPPQRGRPTVDDLPGYTRSLLRIKLPVVVTLARKRQPVGRILELGPGSIIQFEKSCEEMLDLDVGERLIATGEAVKVGEKFGLRLTSITLPEERFVPVRKVNTT